MELFVKVFIGLTSKMKSFATLVNNITKNSFLGVKPLTVFYKNLRVLTTPTKSLEILVLENIFM